MRAKKTALILAVLLIASFFGGCGGNEVEKYEPAVYNIRADYIGSGYTQVENVHGVTVYDSIEAHKNAEQRAKSVWIEDTVADYDVEYVRELIDECDSVIVLSDTDKKTLLNSVTGEATREKAQTDYDFVGMLFADIAWDGGDYVGIYSKDGENSKSELLAFCAQYPFKSEYYYKDDVITEYEKTQKLKDCFNVFDMAGQAFAVSYVTFVDYPENPTISSSMGELKYKFRGTIWSRTEIVPREGKSSGMTSVINAGGEGYFIGYAPEGINSDPDIKIKKGENVVSNFLYGRTVDTVKDPHSDGVIEVLYKGFGDVSSGCQLFFEDKSDVEYRSYKPFNLTVTADLIDLYGHYLSDCRVEFKTEKDGVTTDWRFTVALDEWALAWGDNYEE
ncbi:MAG: hypothetical protein J6L92_07945 [Clostridia bacterium]|nr:hypothetical protein [Clostridia bacterium]